MSSLPLDHSGLGDLSTDECLDRLRSARVGGSPLSATGHAVVSGQCGMDGDVVVFKNTTWRRELIAADDEVAVAFEVDGFDPDRRTGWSVLLRGVATSVLDPVETARLDQLGVWPWADMVERRHWVRIKGVPESGRRVVGTAHPPRGSALAVTGVDN